MARWTIPQELKEAPPRHCKAKISFLLSCFSAIALLALMLLSTATTYKNIHNLQTLKTTGTSIDGVVKSLPTKLISGKHAHTNYHVDYEYHLILHYPDGDKDTAFRRTAFVFFPDYTKLLVGAKVPVIYDPNMPGKSALTFEAVPGTALDDPVTIPGLTTYAANGMVIAFLILFGIWIIKQYLKAKNLLTYGQATQAFIVEEREWYSRGRRFFNLTYKFQDGRGQTIQGKTAVPAAQLTGHEEELTVLYDPNDSTKNALYPVKFVTYC
jgi:hypothetical protein